MHKLRDEYGQGGFLHFGQGKWYPGEQLPRWALSICWRADGQPVWRNPALFADERDPAHYTSDDAKPIWHDPSLFADEREPHAYTADDSRRFIQTLSRKLGLTDRFIEPGYEDTWYYLWRERKLPVNVTPTDPRLAWKEERERFARTFGFALPAWDAALSRCLAEDRTAHAA